MAYSGFDISNQVILVTGGTSGIGRAIALACAEAGAKVIAGSTNPEKVAASRKELGGDNDAVQLDVSDAKSVQAAVDMVVKKYGRIDGMVNAAGVIKRVPSLEMEPADFERIVRVNLVGNFIVAQAVGRVMKEQTPNEKGLRRRDRERRIAEQFYLADRSAGVRMQQERRDGPDPRVGERMGAVRHPRQWNCSGSFSDGFEPPVDRRHTARRMAQAAHAPRPLRQRR